MIKEEKNWICLNILELIEAYMLELLFFIALSFCLMTKWGRNNEHIFNLASMHMLRKSLMVILCICISCSDIVLKFLHWMHCYICAYLVLCLNLLALDIVQCFYLISFLLWQKEGETFMDCLLYVLKWIFVYAYWLDMILEILWTNIV